MVTATRTDGGAESPGWVFNLSFTGKTNGKALSRLNDDDVETMEPSDWKDQYVELYFFKNPGRCSLCRNKTTNDANTKLQVWLCDFCIGTDVMTAANVQTVFGLTRKDLENAPFEEYGLRIASEETT